MHLGILSCESRNVLNYQPFLQHPVHWEQLKHLLNKQLNTLKWGNSLTVPSQTTRYSKQWITDFLFSEWALFLFFRLIYLSLLLTYLKKYRKGTNLHQVQNFVTASQWKCNNKYLNFIATNKQCWLFSRTCDKAASSVFFTAIATNLAAQTTLLASVCHAMPFSAHALKKYFLYHLILW